MTSRTTVAIDKELRKKLKKLSALLDITQAQVIKQALNAYEKELFKGTKSNNNENSEIKEASNLEIQDILKKARELVWKQDPKRKLIQQKLMEGPETIDDFILNNWKTGLE